MLTKQATTLSKHQIAVSGIEMLVCKAAQVTSGRRTFITNRSRTFKCWLDTARSPPPSATAKRMWKRSEASWIWFETGASCTSARSARGEPYPASSPKTTPLPGWARVLEEEEIRFSVATRQKWLMSR